MAGNSPGNTDANGGETLPCPRSVPPPPLGHTSYELFPLYFVSVCHRWCSPSPVIITVGKPSSVFAAVAICHRHRQ